MLISFLLAILAFAFLLIVKTKLQAKKLTEQCALLQTQLQSAQHQNSSLEAKCLEQSAKLEAIHHDSVTGLPAFSLFSDRLHQSIAESARYQWIFGVMLIDINDFKVLNDVLGQSIGDALLKEVGKRLQSCIRQIDGIARLSKDIFIVMLSQLSKPASAAIIAQRMLQALSQTIQINEHTLHVSASIGMAFYPIDGQDAPTLLRHADLALHLAKQSGKQSYQFYQERLQEQSKRELVLYMSLTRDALHQAFSIHYAPIMAVTQESIFCMETVVEAKYELTESVSADEIYRYAEKLHKMNSLSEWMLQHACKQFLHWQTLGFSPTYLAIPLRLKQLENSHFIYRVSQILQEMAFDPKHLMIELSGEFENISFDVIEKALNMLTYLGVQIAIDDFGADTLPLRYLKNANIRYLKLDQRLIGDILSNERTQAWVSSLVLFTQGLSMSLMVKGVESKEEAVCLQALGCHYLQGKFVAIPRSLEEALVI